MPPKALWFALLGVFGAICRLPNCCPGDEDGELLRNPLLPGLGAEELPRNPPLPGLGETLPLNPPVAGVELRNPPCGLELFRGARLARTPPPYC
jgi:hypothetical protein